MNTKDLLGYAWDTLAPLVAIPSVSAENRGLPECARAVRRALEDVGLRARYLRAPGAPPAVFAESEPIAGAPRILFYNHYDVQPADPLPLWHSDPFTLTRRGGIWYGRGTTDDKGELVSRLAALREIRRRHGGRLPFQAKFLVEGEEEVGSPHLASIVRRHRRALAADAAIWESGGTDATGRPEIYAGVKGLLALELRVRTAGRDLHSSLGAVVDNPIYRLAAALASLRDDDGRVRIEGFYDDVRPLTAAEQKRLRAAAGRAAADRACYGTRRFLGGARGVAYMRRLLCEPCVNFNGFHSGYGGPGSKTVLPAEASAKLDIRLAPDQTPARALRLLRRHLRTRGFGDIEVVCRAAHGVPPARSKADHPWVDAARAALRAAYGRPPVFYPSMAATGPMFLFTETLGLPTIGVGIGYPDKRMHSPDENLREGDLARGVAALVRLLETYRLPE